MKTQGTARNSQKTNKKPDATLPSSKNASDTRNHFVNDGMIEE